MPFVRFSRARTNATDVVINTNHIAYFERENDDDYCRVVLDFVSGEKAGRRVLHLDGSLSEITDRLNAAG